MGSQLQAIINAAEGYLGIKESPPNSNNVIFNTRYYGRAVSGSGYPWCAAFIWCLFQDIKAPELYYGGNKTASCTTLMNFAKQHGLFCTSNFRRGDLALFDFDGDRNKSEHIGIITEVKSASVVTIEGNTSTGNDSDGGEVQRRTRSNSLIIGVYRPNYKEDEDMLTQEQFETMYKTMMDKQAKLGVNPNIAPNEFDAAVNAGITDGTRPQSLATRQEVAVMVSRLMEKG